jgi:hypothetical protein
MLHASTYCMQDVRRWFTAVWQAQFWWPGNRAPQLTTTQALTNFHRQVRGDACNNNVPAPRQNPPLQPPSVTSGLQQVLLAGSCRPL